VSWAIQIMNSVESVVLISVGALVKVLMELECDGDRFSLMNR